MALQLIKLGEVTKNAVKKVNENFTELYNLIANKVENVDGKGLSTNDYTTEEKNKLAGIATGAQVNVIETVNVNGTTLTPSSKAVNIDLSGYAKKTEIPSVNLDDYATTEEMNSGLAGKVDKVEGKGLSTNDYTNEEKAKLAGLSAPINRTFTASEWGTATDGYYTMTVATDGKRPVAVMRANGSTYEQSLVHTAVSGSNVILTSEETFEGYVVLV